MSCYIGVCDGYNLDGTKRIRTRTLKKPFRMSDAKFQKLVQEETLKKESTQSREMPKLRAFLAVIGDK